MDMGWDPPRAENPRQAFCGTAAAQSALPRRHFPSEKLIAPPWLPILRQHPSWTSPCLPPMLPTRTFLVRNQKSSLRLSKPEPRLGGCAIRRRSGPDTGLGTLRASWLRGFNRQGPTPPRYLSKLCVWLEKMSMLAIGLHDGRIRHVDALTGEDCWEKEGHLRSIQGVAISRDCRSLASSSADHSFVTWDAPSGSTRLIKRGHDAKDGCTCERVRDTWATSIALNPDCPVVGHKRTVHAVAFSPCGRRLQLEERTAWWSSGTHKVGNKLCVSNSNM